MEGIWRNLQETGRSVPEPIATGCTFTDEMWRTQTVHNPLLSYSLKDGKPSLRATTEWVGHPRNPPRTAARRTRAEDAELWKSSSTPEDYEGRKRALYEKRRLEREEWIQKQPVFHKFPSLPPELRLYIWKLAMEEPVEVQLAASKYTLAIRGAGWCGTRSPPRPLNLAAIAILPPLMLVNHESHAIASTYYKRAFRGVGGAGGVLAAYPTVLRADRYPDSHDAIDLLHPNELGLVQVFALKLEGLMVERVMHQVWKVLEAPNLKRIVVETKDWWKLGPPRTCVALREFVEPKLSVSDPNVPEVELIIKNSNEGSLEGAYYFRGSIFDLPSSYEIL